MSTPALNPHVTISSPFGVADLPTLCVWRNRLHRLNGEPEENLETFMEEHLNRQNVQTFAAYRDEELGGYFEAMSGELSFASDSSVAAVTKVEMVFKREFFRRRPEKLNGASAGGQEVTNPALNLVLRHLFDEGDYELVFFPVAASNRPIQSLVMSVGSASVGVVDDGVGLYLLSRKVWEQANSQFIAEYEQLNPPPVETEPDVEMEYAE